MRKAGETSKREVHGGRRYCGKGALWCFNGTSFHVGLYFMIPIFPKASLNFHVFSNIAEVSKNLKTISKRRYGNDARKESRNIPVTS